jgi:hypothetical protein
MPHQKIPKQMMAFSIAYDDATPSASDGPVIRSVASFNVVRTNAKEARFSIVHEVYRSDNATAEALTDMRIAIDPDDVILGYDDRSIAMPANAVGDSMQRHRLALPMIGSAICEGAILVTDDDGALQEIAGAYGLRIPAPDDPPIRHMRLAAERVQAIWLYWLWSCTEQPDRQYLASAYHAWSALERARPVSF